MARAKPANLPSEDGEQVVEQTGPQIEYFGEGAENVEIPDDPKAVRLRVFASGLILTDY